MTGMKPGLLFARDEEWRTARRTLTPTFSAFKMKAVSTYHVPLWYVEQEQQPYLKVENARVLWPEQY